MSEQAQQKSTETKDDPSNVIIPLELIDKCIGSSIHAILTNNREFVGKLVGFDDFVNIVLEDAKEYELQSESENKGKYKLISSKSRMLLNSRNLALIVPGGVISDELLI
ncbi:unnamed protein product [Ambrosiozyma monospora]|uniref:LSM complex subunit LSM5 n=1 Tax=Ambrosiozyma monospora TaxID=43982 RepID=A0A9W6T387_AMBMO|nr:unnamed protein product [Ambrosiozyma monospora]